MIHWREQFATQDRIRREEVLTLPTIELKHHARLTSPSEGLLPECTSVGPAGELLTVWAANAHRTQAFYRRQRGPNYAATSPEPLPVQITSTGVRDVASIPDLPLPSLIGVQPLPGGRYLVVAARSQWRPNGAVHNAYVYGTGGMLINSETLGDGIEHVATTPSGQIWVGYFDEGVVGTGEDQPPVGRPGLVRFGDDLQMNWSFPYGLDHPWGYMISCDALNIDGERAWTCYHGDYPLVRIDRGRVRHWDNSIRTAHVLLADDKQIAFGAFSRPCDRDLLVIATIDQGQTIVTARLRPVLPGGQEVPTTANLIGRGPELTVIVGNECFRLDLDDVPPDTPNVTLVTPSEYTPPEGWT